MDVLLQKQVCECIFYRSFVRLFKVKLFEIGALRFYLPNLSLAR